MIVGVLLRHYKNYSGLNFVPVTSNLDDKLSIYAGINGVGKTAILESLNYFFNDVPWILTKNTKRNEAFVAPLFLLPKSSFKKNTNVYKEMEKQSNSLWNYDITKVKQSTPEINKIIELRDSLKSSNKNDEFFLLLPFKYPFGREEARELKSIQTLYGERGEQEDDSKLDYSEIVKTLQDLYCYIYLPVERDVKTTTSLHNAEMQRLMGKNILTEIENILSTNVKVDDAGNERDVKLVDAINFRLESFISSINDSVGKIDSGYNYKVGRGTKKELQSKDIRDKIVEAYFNVRVLKKHSKSVNELSSGEQRIALIDIVYAFLTNADRPEKKVIFAIDEPEVSMHTSTSFEQFRRIADLANIYNYQTLITSHWYGFLPLSQRGNIHCLECTAKGVPEFSTFSLLHSIEQRKKFPDDIQLKSYFDLVSSIISVTRGQKINWLICEGPDDKLYLGRMLKDKKIPNLVILPVGGAGNVIKIFNYLGLPLNDKTEAKKLKGKIFCLIDTDASRVPFDSVSDIADSILRIRRLQQKDDTINFVKLEAGGEYTPTELEDCLDSKIYYEAVKEFIDALDDDDYEEIKTIFSFFDYDNQVKHANVSNNLSFLKLNDLQGSKKENIIYDLIMDNHQNKYEIATKYIEIYEDKDAPQWIGEIAEFYK